MLRMLGLFNTFLLHLFLQLSGFWLLLRVQDVQRLVLECEDPRRSLQRYALRRDGLDQIELSWHDEERIIFVAWSEGKSKAKKQKQRTLIDMEPTDREALEF